MKPITLFRYYLCGLQLCAALIMFTKTTMASVIMEDHFSVARGGVIWGSLFLAGAVGLCLSKKLAGVVYFTFPLGAYAGLASAHIFWHGLGYMTLLFAVATYVNLQIIWWLLSERNNHV